VRRLLISLSIRLGISIREIETWQMTTIREFVAVLTAQSKDNSNDALREQSPEELERALMKTFGKPPSGTK
jgi:hypothetical protein